MSKTIPNNQIRFYRQKRHLRLRDVAKLIDQASLAHLSHFENNDRLPSLRNALLLSAAIGCPVEVLFSDLFNQLRNKVHDNKTKHRIELTYS